MYKVESRWGHQKYIKVEWNLGKRCNYDCSYCPALIHDNKSPHTNIDLLKSTVDKLKLLHKPIRLSFTGGEPTVHPNFEELLEHCKNTDIEFVSVTTNATRKASYYINLPVTQIVFSLHFEYDWEKCLETIIMVGSSDIQDYQKKKVLVHVMAIHDKMEEVRQTIKRLKFYNIPYAVRRVRWSENQDHDIFDDLRYEQSDLDFIKSENATVEPNVIIDDSQSYHANDVIKLHLNQYKGWTCNIGIESLMINWDGEVHRATCRVGGSLGNIYSDTFIVPTEPVICTRNFCTCAADIPITKHEK